MRVRELDCALTGRSSLDGYHYFDSNQWPIAKLRETFSREEVQEWWTQHKPVFTSYYSKIVDILKPRMYPTTTPFDQWRLDFCEWIIVDCGFVLNDEITAGGHFLDYVLVWAPPGPFFRRLFDFLRKHGAKSCYTWENWIVRLAYAYFDKQMFPDFVRFWRNFTPMCHALLDAGANAPAELAVGSKHNAAVGQQVAEWYSNRLHTRQICLLILALGKRGRWRDVAGIIAKMVWESRFENKVYFSF